MFKKNNFSQKKAGFILLEIIASVAIFSTAILAVMRSFSSGIDLNQHSLNYSEAVFLSNRIINRLELQAEQLREGEEKINNRLFKWRVEVVEQEDNQELQVIVSWKEREKEYHLKTSNVYPLGFIN